MEAIVKNEKKLKSKAVALTALAGSALLMVGAGCAAPAADKDGAKDGAPAPAATDTGASGAAMQAKGTYKDGTYSAVGHYTSPAGPETINVTLTLKGNVITDADVKAQATNKKSVFMQNSFISGYKAQVVGKNINDVKLSGNISGSSLTLMGFNDAVAQVKTQASK